MPCCRQTQIKSPSLFLEAFKWNVSRRKKRETNTHTKKATCLSVNSFTGVRLSGENTPRRLKVFWAPCVTNSRGWRVGLPGWSSCTSFRKACKAWAGCTQRYFHSSLCPDQVHGGQGQRGPVLFLPAHQSPVETDRLFPLHCDLRRRWGLRLHPQIFSVLC